MSCSIALFASVIIAVAANLTCKLEGQAYHDPVVVLKSPENQDPVPVPPPSTPNGAFLADAASCQASCASSPSCMYFTWYADSQGCWLLGGEAHLVPAKYAVSGPRKCTQVDGAAHAGANHSGTDAGSQITTNEVMDGLAKLVENKADDLQRVQDAKQVQEDINQGMLGQHWEATMNVVNAAQQILTPESAAKQGLLLNLDDLNNMAHVQHREAHFANSQGGALNFVQGDILLGSAAQEASATTESDIGGSYGAGRPWTGANVKYCYDIFLKALSKKAFQTAMERISYAVPGISFTDVGYKSKETCQEVPAIFVTSSEGGCWSELGMMWYGFPGEPNQLLNLNSPGCDNVPTALHELLHALGMAHEQARPDRDQYITLHTQNIRAGKESQFRVNSHADTARPYDILSIMHYTADEFSVAKPLPTISVKQKGFEVYTDNPAEYSKYRLGQRMGMSKYDVGQLLDLYGCNADKTVCNPPEGMNLFHIILMAAACSCSLCCCGYMFWLLCCRRKSRPQYNRLNKLTVDVGSDPQSRQQPGTPKDGRQPGARQPPGTPKDGRHPTPQQVQGGQPGTRQSPANAGQPRGGMQQPQQQQQQPRRPQQQQQQQQQQPQQQQQQPRPPQQQQQQQQRQQGWQLVGPPAYAAPAYAAPGRPVYAAPAQPGRR